MIVYQSEQRNLEVAMDVVTGNVEARMGQTVIDTEVVQVDARVNVMVRDARQWIADKEWWNWS